MGKSNDFNKRNFNFMQKKKKRLEKLCFCNRIFFIYCLIGAFTASFKILRYFTDDNFGLAAKILKDQNQNN